MNSAAGTNPPGASSEQQAAQWVQRMFTGIAPKYDLVNHLLSFNIDRRWRKVLMAKMTPVLQRSDARVLDLCCGTGDVLLDFEAISISPVLGADFCHPMLVSTRRKAARKGFQAKVFEADALQLPISDGALDAISIAFGFRNLANYMSGLKELYRVLKPGGMLAILEFSHPSGRFTKTTYDLYSRIFLPLIGAAISGSTDAYTYLPDSIRKFPEAEELRRMMQTSGFENTSYELLTGGIAALHLGRTR